MYSDNEVEEYNNYMNYIRELIIDESVNKFKLKVTLGQLEIKDVMKDKESNKWKFYYKIMNPYNDNWEIWRGKPKIDGMTKQINYDDWKLKKIADAREQRLKDLGI